VRNLLGSGGQIGGTILNAVFALGFAVLIWAAVGARLTTVETFSVPFEIEVPADVVVECRDPPAPPGRAPFVEVAVRGPHELLGKPARELFDRGGGRIKLEVDESMLGGAEQTVTVSASNFRITTKGVDVTSVVPDRIKLVLSRVGHKEFQVRPDIVGTPAPGYRLHPTSPFALAPTAIEVTGPNNLLMKHAGPLKTFPIDVSGMTASVPNFIRDVRVPEGLVAKDRVNVTVVIEPEPVDEEFDLPVVILTSPDNFKQSYEVKPRSDPPEWKARVTLRGPQADLKAFRERLVKHLMPPGEEPIAFIRLMNPISPTSRDYARIEVMNLPPGIRVPDDKPPTFNYSVVETKGK
jgi:hypothetical protein